MIDIEEAALVFGGQMIESHDQKSARLLVTEVHRQKARIGLTDDLTLKVENISVLPMPLIYLIKSHDRDIIDYLVRAEKIEDTNAN